MEVIDVIPNALGGWAILTRNGQELQAVGNYATRADALRIARYNGYTEAKKSALTK